MKKFILICLLLGLFSPLFAVNATSNMGVAVNATNDSNYQDQFAVSGDYLVYSDKLGDRYDLYLLNLKDNSKLLLATQQWVTFDPAIDGKNIVWVEHSYGKSIIWYNIDTKIKTAIARQTGYTHDIHPDVQGNIITFTRWNFVDNISNIMFYKIDQRVLDGVFSVANSRQTNQANNANNVVWQDDRNKLNEIYLYNFNTKQTKVLGQNGLNHYFPKVAGQNVVWQSNNAIYAYNLDSNSLQVIGSNNYANFNADVSGQNVVYQSIRHGNHDIYLYNLKTKSEVQITTDPQDDDHPILDGDRLFWTKRNAEGSVDIYYQSISAYIEKLYSRLSFRTLAANRVEISWPQADPEKYSASMLYRSTAVNEQGRLIADHVNTNSYIDGYLDLKQTYYYTLHLIDKEGRELVGDRAYAYQPGARKLVKLANSPSVYLVDGQEYYVISSRSMFNYFQFNDKDVRTIYQSELDQYSYKGSLLFPSGSLLKVDYDPAVYLVYDNTVRPFESAEVFLRAGYAWNMIKKVRPEIFSSYQRGDKLTLQNFTHSNGALFRYSNQPTVFLMENGKRRAISSEKVFNTYGFRWSDVIYSPTYWQYPDGPAL